MLIPISNDQRALLLINVAIPKDKKKMAYNFFSYWDPKKWQILIVASYSKKKIVQQKIFYNLFRQHMDKVLATCFQLNWHSP